MDLLGWELQCACLGSIQSRVSGVPASDLGVSSEAGAKRVPPGPTREVRGSPGGSAPITPALRWNGGCAGVLGLLSQVPTTQTAEIR